MGGGSDLPLFVLQAPPLLGVLAFQGTALEALICFYCEFVAAARLSLVLAVACFSLNLQT